MGSVLFIFQPRRQIYLEQHRPGSNREYVVSSTSFQPMIGLYKPESGLLGNSRRIFINVERPGIFFNHAGIHGHFTHIVQ